MTPGASVRAVFQGTEAASLNAWLSAIDGKPRSKAVIAAPTVPENTVSTPRLAPRLMPDSTMSGGASRIRCRAAMTTQSPGVPWTAKQRSPRASTRSGLCRLSECEVPLWSCAGATVHTSRASDAATSCSTCSPGALIPSSLVSRTRSKSGGVSCIGSGIATTCAAWRRRSSREWARAVGQAPVVDQVHRGDERVADQQQQEPRAEFARVHDAPAGRLVRMQPGRAERADVLAQPDEQRHQAQAEQERHAAPPAPDAVVDAGAPEQHAGGREQQPPRVRQIVMREEIDVDRQTQRSQRGQARVVREAEIHQPPDPREIAADARVHEAGEQRLHVREHRQLSRADLAADG